MQRTYSPPPKRRRRGLACVVSCLIAGTLLWPESSRAGSGELLVVVNKANPTSRLSASDLRPIFRTSKRTWENGTTVEPVNMPEQTSPRMVFDRAVLGFDADATLRYWIDRKVRGEARPPRKLASTAAVLAYVAATPGGIGYVPEGQLSSGVKVVARIAGNQVKAP